MTPPRASWRQTGDEYVQTVKQATLGSFARGEWEAEVQSGAPDFRKVRNTPVAPLVSKKIRRKLRPVFQTRVDRVTRPVHVGQSEIELAVDRGKLSAGRQSEPIAELELELKNGRAVDLFRIAKILERRAGAELDLQSKAERGYQLANGNNHGVAVRAEPVQLTKRMTANEAFTVIALSSLRHFSANAGGLRELDPEAIHQMRVGLRRLRAAISLFGEILPAVATAKINAELKWLTTSLAPAREIDVFVKEKITPLERRTEPRRGVRAIESQFSARRTQAFHDARDALGMPRYRALLINVLEWLETRKPNDPDEAGKSIVGFAAGIMHRRLSKARKEGRRLSDLSAHKRHKLRIKIKKIRYAVDFFRSLYPHKAEADLDRLSKRLKRIQDALGALNDFIAHREMATKAALHAPQKNRRARAFASGLVVGQEREASRRLLKAAAKEIRHLRPLSVEPG